MVIEPLSRSPRLSASDREVGKPRFSSFFRLFTHNPESNQAMNDKPTKCYLFASDFDQTLTFNDSGYVLAELVGIPVSEFERKAQGMAKLNLVQQGAELPYLLLHILNFRANEQMVRTSVD